MKYVDNLALVLRSSTNIIQKTGDAVNNPRTFDNARRLYRPDELQMIQSFEDEVNEVVMVLQSNNDVLIAIQSYYRGLLSISGFDIKDSCQEDITTLDSRLKDMIYDLNMQISRTKLLVQLAGDRKTMVR